MEKSYWFNPVLNAGEMVEKTKKSIIFMAKDNIPEIAHLTSSCGCTTPVYKKEDSNLEVSYSSPKVSQHLRLDTGFMTTSQYITVTYVDGGKEVLRFAVKVKIK